MKLDGTSLEQTPIETDRSGMHSRMGVLAVHNNDHDSGSMPKCCKNQNK